MAQGTLSFVQIYMKKNTLVLLFEYLFQAKSRLTGLLDMIESKEETDSVVETRHSYNDEDRQDRQDHRAKVIMFVSLFFKAWHRNSTQSTVLKSVFLKSVIHFFMFLLYRVHWNKQDE